MCVCIYIYIPFLVCLSRRSAFDASFLSSAFVLIFGLLSGFDFAFDFFMPAQGRQKLGQCGTCSQCYALCPKSGKLRKHNVGHGGGDCKGSGSVPVGPDHEGGFHQGMSVEVVEGGVPVSVEGEGGEGLESFIAAFGVDPILKRIPKGARIMAGSVLERVLDRIVDGPEDLQAWSRLFCFSQCLVKPQRGGIRRNLTSSVLARLKFFNDGGVFSPSGGAGFGRVGGLIVIKVGDLTVRW